jgi:hypothetical protein
LSVGLPQTGAIPLREGYFFRGRLGRLPNVTRVSPSGMRCGLSGAIGRNRERLLDFPPVLLSFDPEFAITVIVLRA